MITRFVKLTFRADAIEDFKQIFEESKHKIKAQSGCIQVQLLQDKVNPTVFFTYSIWENESALEAYRASELFATTWQKTKALFQEKASAWTLEALDQV